MTVTVSEDDVPAPSSGAQAIIRKGWDARVRGNEPRTGNPYERYTRSHRLWDQGWQSGYDHLAEEEALREWKEEGGA